MHQRYDGPGSRRPGGDYRGNMPYRSRNGLVFGVCRGLAEHFQAPTFWIRMAFVALLVFTGFWAMTIVYIVAAIIMRPAPVIPLESVEDAEFYNSYTHSRTMALQRLKRSFDSLDRRIQRMEDMVTARDYDWEERLRRE